MRMVRLRARVPPLASWMVILSAEGPTGASTSTPARANQPRPWRPRKNSSLRSSQSPSMAAASGAETRISSGEPATTTAGVRVMTGDWARAAANAKASRPARASQLRGVRGNGENRISFSIPGSIAGEEWLLFGFLGARVRGNPRGHTVLNLFKLIGGDVDSDHLAVGSVFFLIGSFDGGGQVKPEVGLHIVVGNALPDGVEDAERCLRGDVTLLSGLAIPLRGLRHVAGKALAAVAIEHGEMHLAGNGSPIGGLAVPLCRCLICFAGLGNVMHRRCISSVVLAHGDLSGGIAGVGLSQQIGVDSRGLGGDGNQRQSKNCEQKRLQKTRFHCGLNQLSKTIADSG